MMRRLYLVPGALALALAACSSSPPVHYYTLLAPSVATSANEQPAPFLIDVLPVGLPVQLDQSSLVVRQGDSGIAVLDGERWAGLLADELRTAIAHRLVGSADFQTGHPGCRRAGQAEGQVRVANQA